MLLEILIVNSTRQRKHACKCICDECGVEFVHPRYAVRHNRFHFCSRKCSNASQKHGVLIEQVRRTNQNRYGCDYPLCASSRPRMKSEETCIIRYGAKTAWTHNMQKFFDAKGIVNSSQLLDHKEKVQKTSQERYGVNHPFQSQAVKAKIKQTIIHRYGMYPYVNPNVNYFRASQRRHETMKRNGTYRTSHKEDTVYMLLCEIYESQNVERSKRVCNWLMDFYIKTIDVYVQFDGAYWHGLNRSVADIMSSSSLRDKVILSTIERDKKREAYFACENMHLVRIIESSVDLRDLDNAKAYIKGIIDVQIRKKE